MSIDLSGFVRKRTTMKLGGQDFVFTQLTLGDFAKFRLRTIEIKNENKKKRRQEIIEEAQAIGGIDNSAILEKLDRPISDDEIEAEMDTVEGLGYMAFLSLKYKHPDITEEDVSTILTVQNLGEVATAIMGTVDGTKKKITRQPMKKKKKKKK